MEETQVNENPTGAQLDPLIDPPVSATSIVQSLKDKIDRFAYLAANYQGAKKQLQRVMVALAIHPFNERPFEFGYDHEKELFNLGVEIVTQKLMFLNIGIQEQKLAKEIKEKTDKKENENGSQENQSG